MTKRQITPTQLSLFSRSPIVGAWWEELHAQGLFKDQLPEPTALDKQLGKDGLRHEEVLISKLKKDGYRIASLPGKQIERDYQATKEAMADGYDFIWQASLQNEEMRGSADLLRRIKSPSSLGEWSYRPIECKLASKTKTTFLVQACAYCELLTPLLGERPEQFELYLGGGKFLEFATDKFWAWYQLLRKRYEHFRHAFNPNEVPADTPGEHGRWSAFIEQNLEASRDLVLVANMRQSQRLKFKQAGIHTIDDLAALPDGSHVHGLNPNALNELRQQAKLQVKPKAEDGKPHFIVRKTVKGKGLNKLPRADQGDIWFDLEGVQDSVDGKQLEYLMGATYRDFSKNSVVYKAWWAHSPREEKKIFEEWIDWVQQRRGNHPNLRIYHYGNYEKSAIRRLAQQHSTKESIVDEWLSTELLVDLLPVVKGAIVLGEDSYSIKKVEKLYMEQRDAGVKTACDSVVAYRNWEASGEPSTPGELPEGSPQLKTIEDYNREDCESTALLHDWLLKLRRNEGLPDEPLEALQEEVISERSYPLERLKDVLIDELPEDFKVVSTKAGEEESSGINDEGSRGMSWRVQRLLGHLLPFQNREAKVSWWGYFDRRDKAGLSPDELIEDNEVIEGAIWQTVQAKESSRTGADYHTFKFNPTQDLKLYTSEGDRGRLTLEIASTGLKLDVDEINVDRGQVTLKYPWKKKERRLEEGLSDGVPTGPCTLIKVPADIAKPLRERLEAQANEWVYGKQPLPFAMQQLLDRKLVEGLIALNQQVSKEPQGLPELLADFLVDKPNQTIALQGPPGTGKSTVTAQLIAELLQRKKRIAISSNSNPAINNLLLKVKDTCVRSGLDHKIVKCTSQKEDSQLVGHAIPLIPTHAIADDMQVVGGTAWTFSREEMTNLFDVLVVDEAGQMSLANLLVMARCAQSILLVGDQQQLSQPTKANHPGESGNSCLEYLMKGANVVPPDKGIFLATSWRMEPSITDVVSELFYDRKLKANPVNAANGIEWKTPCLNAIAQPFPNKGIVFEPVTHHGCNVRSTQEIDRIEQIVDALLGGTFQHAQRDGIKSGVLTANDILITAPYNVQVNRLQERLKGKAKVGTVDKFQGQEAPVAIHSLTASSGEEAPRGIGFLLEPNRLNVAISRAQCLSIVVGCPDLATGLINTVEEAEQINRLCLLMKSI